MEQLINFLVRKLALGTTTYDEINKFIDDNGIDVSKRHVKEAIELALVRLCRAVDQNLSVKEQFETIQKLYNRQPKVGKMNLVQFKLEQYSTSIPLAFLMSAFAKRDKADALYFEPSAGNGALTIALQKSHTICNEIDEIRLENLRREGYNKVTDQDALKPFGYGKIFDGVVMNPPFLKPAKKVDTMIFNALNCMKDDGRCAILRDGWNQFEDYLGYQHRRSNVAFYDELFEQYNVKKIININAFETYSKQGTVTFMQIILIDGRKKVIDESNHRLKDPDIDITEPCGFKELWNIFKPYINSVSNLLIKELKLLNK